MNGTKWFSVFSLILAAVTATAMPVSAMGKLASVSAGGAEASLPSHTAR
jgi:hypothetical protein